MPQTQTWTHEQIEQVPEVYRDFMLVLKAIPDSRSAPVRVTRIPLGKIFNVLAPNFGYGPEEVRTVAERLKRAGFVWEDDFGMVAPTSRGEALIEAITGLPEPDDDEVPELPPL